MDRGYILSMLKDLVAIPSVTESELESAPGEMLYKKLSALAYFRENPTHLRFTDTPLEGSRHALKSLFVRVDAARKTLRTILLIGHYDVVSPACYGKLAEHAFDVDKLSEIMGADSDTLYGRGVMDMKCGVAIEIALIEDFARDRTLFDVNIVLVLVGDEENSSAGMRGILPLLAEVQSEGLDFLAAVNMEPGEAGQSGTVGPKVFLGTLGKLMPAFYIRGVGAHVGNCFDGFSAALVLSRLVEYAECRAEFGDPIHGECQPSWICLDMKTMRDGYSVTEPDRAYAYFNCFTTSNGPNDILAQMKSAADAALRGTAEQMTESCRAISAMGYRGSEFVAKKPVVYTFCELTEIARRHTGDHFDTELQHFIEALPQGDMRARGIKCVDFIADHSGTQGPYAVCFFLPPWLPVRTDFTDDPRDVAAVEASRAVERVCSEKYGLEMAEVEFFAGLCDLSYAGAKVSEDDVHALSENMPGWGQIYGIPLAEMRGLGLPVINLGPSGESPHRQDERLYLHYSLDVLPDLLVLLIRELSSRSVR